MHTLQLLGQEYLDIGQKGYEARFETVRLRSFECRNDLFGTTRKSCHVPGRCPRQEFVILFFRACWRGRLNRAIPRKRVNGMEVERGFRPPDWYNRSCSGTR
jgi:hypothetical protein